MRVLLSASGSAPLGSLCLVPCGTAPQHPGAPARGFAFAGSLPASGSAPDAPGTAFISAQPCPNPNAPLSASPAVPASVRGPGWARGCRGSASLGLLLVGCSERSPLGRGGCRGRGGPGQSQLEGLGSALTLLRLGAGSTVSLHPRGDKTRRAVTLHQCVRCSSWEMQSQDQHSRWFC